MIIGRRTVWVLGLILFGFVAEAQQGKGQGQQGRGGPDGGPKVGDAAPDFKIKSLADPNKEVQLSTFKDKKPVCLIFGSYT